jgi:hypothetical protein
MNSKPKQRRHRQTPGGDKTGRGASGNQPAQRRPQAPHPAGGHVAATAAAGGVKSIRGEGALFSVEASVGGCFRAPLVLETARLAQQEAATEGPAWWQGLLLLVARDAMEGDLSLGWGKGRGYGAVGAMLHPEARVPPQRWPSLKQRTARLSQGHGEAWPQVIEALQGLTGAEPADWIEQLHQRIAGELQRHVQPAPQASD